MANVLLLTDSRGSKFQTTIDLELQRRHSTCSIKVEYVRGGTIETVTEKGLKLLKERHYDACYLFAGVNDLTKQYAKRYCVLSYYDIPSLVDSITDEYETARSKLLKLTPNIIICHLIGISLADYNKLDEGGMSHDQKIINMSTYHVNHAINSMNSDRNAIGPWLSDSIHANINGRHVHKYARLIDGLHPTDQTLKIWAKKIITSIETLHI